MFVALYPPAEAVQHLSRSLVTAMKLTPVQKWHITLAFLGEVPAERLPALETALAAVGVPRGRQLRLRGGGDFGGRVTWAGVDGELGDLAAAVRTAVRLTDPRPFAPHLTVAYAHDAALSRTLATYAGPSWTVQEIALVHSDQGVYRTVARY